MQDNINTTVKGKYSFVGSIEDFKCFIKNNGEFIQTTEDKCSNIKLDRKRG
jgi:hypothetical protein